MVGIELEIEEGEKAADVPERTKQFVESKDLVAASIQEYENCLRITGDPDNHTVRQVREANEFLAKYKDKDDLPF